MHRLVLLLALVALPSAAFADDASGQVCETTTRCTGAAAPLAVPGHVAAPAPVAEPAPLIEPPAYRAPNPYAPSGCAACASTASTLPLKLDGGWRLTLDEEGTPVYQRKKRTGQAGVWVPGLVMWLASYTGSTIASFENSGISAIPFFGALALGGINLLDGELGPGFGYTLGGLLQVGGFIMFVAGAASGQEKIERIPVRVSPLAFRDGGGLSIAARF